MTFELLESTDRTEDQPVAVLPPRDGFKKGSDPLNARGFDPLLKQFLRYTILRRYRQCSLSTRLFLRLRWRLTPYEAIAARLPHDGVILDLGSGHGLLALTLALQSADRQVFGVDHDEARVAMANKAAADLPNVQFAVGDFTAFLRQQTTPPAAVVIMDAMHYLTFTEQKQLVERAWTLLPAGGMLVVREVDTQAGLTSRINKIHERVMTWCGFTRADHLFFRSPAGWHDLFTSRGFESDSERCSCFPFADRLFICLKAAASTAQPIVPSRAA
jgi:2-polyprenyl-3-methyl-5-hydroxy-6-metoxy-1,4-benzoquinol methylase